MRRGGVNEFVGLPHPDPNVPGCVGGYLRQFGGSQGRPVDYRRKVRDRAHRRHVRSQKRHMRAVGGAS